MTKFRFTASSVRTVASPSNPDITIYFVWVNFKDLPDDFPTDVNPRKPKLTTSVGKQLVKAVIDSNPYFDINNRGVVITAKGFNYETSSRTVMLDLGDNVKRYGLLDGGHTYRAILENRDQMAHEMEKFVRLEVVVGANLDVVGLADARNTSAEVSDIALYELDNKFDLIKNAISNEPYADEVAYKDNDNKEIPVIELLKLMFAYNIKKFPDDMSVPTQAYSGKSMVFKNYKEEYSNIPQVYAELAAQLPKLVNLYEVIESTIPEYYKVYKRENGTGSAFGKLRGVNGAGDFYTDFTRQNASYQIPAGYLLPIFGAFRALLKYKDTTHRRLKWSFDPIEVWNSVGVSLVQNTFETSGNPQMAGKDANLWRSNYRIVDSKSKDLLIKQLTGE